MEILSIFNTNVKLEEGDLIAIDEKQKRLYIRRGDKVFVSCNSVDSSHLEQEVCVSSAGSYLKHQATLPKLNWREYSRLERI